MNKNKTILQLVLFSLCFFVLGYFRYAVFLNINERASLIYYKSTYPALPSFLSTFEHYNYADLIYLKWAFTLSFTLLYALLSAYALKVVFNARTHAYTALGFYGFLFLISMLFVITATLIPTFNAHGYNIARSLSHFEQSPIIALLLLIAIYAYKRRQ